MLGNNKRIASRTRCLQTGWTCVAEPSACSSYTRSRVSCKHADVSEMVTLLSAEWPQHHPSCPLCICHMAAKCLPRAAEHQCLGGKVTCMCRTQIRLIAAWVRAQNVHNNMAAGLVRGVAYRYASRISNGLRKRQPTIIQARLAQSP
jgi:hypothetical protein